MGDLGNVKSEGGKVKVNVRDKIALLLGQKSVKKKKEVFVVVRKRN